ncbi:hypothetical protein B0J13DRAFT_641091 [Dactylonectria estremocensis]|uniref:Mid2 domain-containing protein n=1 Tax=Dactylonectria estremocensis TaxID=1079267 RepID=A0A9P9ECC1_9HYPO|nr:hypothetical protein B0J13DRAFT_641091 [Dactylonectria estremocensis]
MFNIFRLLFSLALASTALSSTTFTNPAGDPPGDLADNPTYTIGNKLNIEWETEYDEINLVLFQVFSDDSHATGWILQNTNATNYRWTVGFDDVIESESTLNPSALGDSIFYLRIYKTGSRDGGRSRYFNLTGSVSESSESKSTTSLDELTASADATGTAAILETEAATLPTVAATRDSLEAGETAILAEGTATATGTTATGTTTSSTTVSLDSDSNKSGLSSGAIAGIAAAATIVGIAFLVGVVGFCGIRRFRNKKDEDNHDESILGGHDLPEIVTPSNDSRTHEMATDLVVAPGYELPGQKVHVFAAELESPASDTRHELGTKWTDEYEKKIYEVPGS